MSNTVYVITGANRGIGLGLVQAYLARPHTTVVAVVRSIAAATTLMKAVHDKAAGDGSLLHIFQLDLSKPITSEAIRERFVAELHNVDHVNVLICNAGHASPLVRTVEITSEELEEAFRVNTIAPLKTFQALWPLMGSGESSNATLPKFIVMTSTLGSMGDMPPPPGGAYGPSKAAVNHIVKSLHVQMEGLVSVAVHPGFVITDMSLKASNDWNGIVVPKDTVEECARELLEVIDKSTRENFSGTLIDRTGRAYLW